MSYYQLKCEQSNDYWHCKLYPQHGGTCALAEIRFELDREVIGDLNGLIPDDGTSAILEVVMRDNVCDRDKNVKNVALLLICNVVEKLHKQGIRVIFLFALHDKLISLYRDIGFQSVPNMNPANMIASTATILSVCKQRNAPKLSITLNEP